MTTPTASLPSRRMSLEEFLGWTDEDIWAEWIEGADEWSPSPGQARRTTR